MFALEPITRFTVIKAGGSRSPLHQGEILAVMFGVALRTLLAGGRIQAVGSVQATMCIQSCSNLRMTLQTLESGLSAKFVAGCAMSGAFQSLMGSRERSGGNLCLRT